MCFDAEKRMQPQRFGAQILSNTFDYGNIMPGGGFSLYMGETITFFNQNIKAGIDDVQSG